MKKPLILLLMAVLTLSLLVGCGPSEEEKIENYLDFTQEMAGDNADVFSDLSPLVAKTRTATWHKEMEDTLGRLKDNSQDILDYKDVPEAYEETHKYQSLAAEVYIVFVDDYLTAIEESDHRAEIKAYDLLPEAGIYTKKATEAIKGVE